MIYLSEVVQAKSQWRNASEENGGDSQKVAECGDKVADLYVAQGQYARAESLYLRSLKVRERELDLEHLDVTAGLDKLATLYGNTIRKKQTVYLCVR